MLWRLSLLLHKSDQRQAAGGGAPVLRLRATPRSPGGAARSRVREQSESRSGHAGRSGAWGAAWEARRWAACPARSARGRPHAHGEWPVPGSSRGACPRGSRAWAAGGARGPRGGAERGGRAGRRGSTEAGTPRRAGGGRAYKGLRAEGRERTAQPPSGPAWPPRAAQSRALRSAAGQGRHRRGSAGPGPRRRRRRGEGGGARVAAAQPGVLAAGRGTCDDPPCAPCPLSAAAAERPPARPAAPRAWSGTCSARRSTGCCPSRSWPVSGRGQGLWAGRGPRPPTSPPDAGRGDSPGRAARGARIPEA